MKVIDALWFTNNQGTIGIIIAEDDTTKERKVYIGTVPGITEDEETIQILDWGNQLPLSIILRLKHFLTGIQDLTDDEIELIHTALVTHYALTKDIVTRERIINIHKKLRGG